MKPINTLKFYYYEAIDWIAVSLFSMSISLMIKNFGHVETARLLKETVQILSKNDENSL